MTTLLNEKTLVEGGVYTARYYLDNLFLKKYGYGPEVYQITKDIEKFKKTPKVFIEEFGTAKNRFPSLAGLKKLNRFWGSHAEEYELLLYTGMTLEWFNKTIEKKHGPTQHIFLYENRLLAVKDERLFLLTRVTENSRKIK